MKTMTMMMAEFRANAEALRDQRDELLYGAAEDVRALAGRLEQIAHDVDDWLSEGRVIEVETAIGQVIELVGDADFAVIAELASIRFPGEPDGRPDTALTRLNTLTTAELPALPDSVGDTIDDEIEWERDLRQARDDRRRMTADHIRDLVSFADDELLYGRRAAAERGDRTEGTALDAFAAELASAFTMWRSCVNDEDDGLNPAPVPGCVEDLVRSGLRQQWPRLG
jgi:hypothetical protein